MHVENMDLDIELRSVWCSAMIMLNCSQSLIVLLIWELSWANSFHYTRLQSDTDPLHRHCLVQWSSKIKWLIQFTAVTYKVVAYQAMGPCMDRNTSINCVDIHLHGKAIPSFLSKRKTVKKWYNAGQEYIVKQTGSYQQDFRIRVIWKYEN